MLAVYSVVFPIAELWMSSRSVPAISHLMLMVFVCSGQHSSTDSGQFRTLPTMLTAGYIATLCVLCLCYPLVRRFESRRQDVCCTSGLPDCFFEMKAVRGVISRRCPPLLPLWCLR